MRRFFLASMLLSLTACGGSPRWNLLLVTLDTTRADFLGCYGKQSARTPNLDRLADEGFLFEQALASNPVTQPAHSTILTGVYPMVHGVRDNVLFRLPEERETLAELLAAQGYRTGAAVGGFPLTREFGTAQGFDFYDDDLTADRRDPLGRAVRRERATWYDERPAGHVNDAIRPWLREADARPFFAWLHYWDPHEPHIAPSPYRELFAHDPYQGEIAYADQSLGALLDELRASGAYERTLIVITADHGEGRYEHNEVTHAFLAYNTTLHVPMIVRVPGQAGGRRIAERVGTVDIVPTILSLLDLPLPEHLQGRTLRPLMLAPPGGPRPEPRDYYSESLSPRLTHGFSELRVLYRGRFKYIYGPRPELFDLEADPHERRDLSAEQPATAARAQTALQEFLGRHASSAAAEATYQASDETRRRLEALGYVGGGSDDEPQTVTEELLDGGIAPQDRVGDINLVGRLRQALDAGQFRLAIATASRLVAGAPDNAFYRAKLAAAHVGLGEIEEAAQVVHATTNVSAANVADFLLVARALFDDGQRERGLAMADTLLQTEQSAVGWLLLARMRHEAGDEAACERALGHSLELDPKSRAARLERVEHMVASRRTGEADVEVRRLLADYPADIETHLAFVHLLGASGQEDQALAHLDGLLTRWPAACALHFEQVQLLATLERGAPAAEALKTMRRRCRDRELVARAAQLVESK